MRIILAAAAAALALTTAGGAQAAKHVVTGTFAPGTTQTFTLAGVWYEYFSGTFEFEGADLLEASIYTDWTLRVRVRPTALGIQEVEMGNGCSAEIGETCLYDSGFLNPVDDDTLRFRTANRYTLSPLEPVPIGLHKREGRPIRTTFNFEFAPYDDATEISYTLKYHTLAVPEPGTWALMIVGFGAAGAALRRRSAAAA